MRKRALILAALIAVSGCAAHPDPIVDMKGVDPERFARDRDDCERYAEDVEIGAGVMKGGTLGAAVGAAAGAIHGNTARGAADGALYGGTRSGLDADRDRQQVFKRCLAGRGYRVLNW